MRKLVPEQCSLAAGRAVYWQVPHLKFRWCLSWLILMLPATCFSQHSVGPETAAPHFYWSIRKAHQLDYKKQICNSPDLNSTERAELTSRVANLIRPHRKDLEFGSERELSEIASRTRMELIDLNGDGVPEIVLQAFGVKEGCGATGNCPFWVLQSGPNGYGVLLDTRDKDGIGGAELLTVESTLTNGFKDLVLAAHDSASEKSLLVYRFEQGRYRETACYDAEWASWAGENLRQLKLPVITPGCSH